jgi:hypothetical protein
LLLTGVLCFSPLKTVTELGRGLRRLPSGIYSRIVNKVSNLILVPFWPVGALVKCYSHSLLRHLVRVPSQRQAWHSATGVLTLGSVRFLNYFSTSGLGLAPRRPISMNSIFIK